MIEIVKASGVRAPFDSEKLRASLRRVGAEENIINQIVDEVKKRLVSGMSTHRIYRIAFQLLRKKSRDSAAKYHLKRAIMNLGETGFAFEKYFAVLLQYKGYKTRNNQIVNGYCISHEVDIIANQDNREIIIECKYHHRQGLSTDVTIALYFKARFMDVVQGYKNPDEKQFEGWLVTNLRFTTEAMKYGRCAKLNLVAWDYPEKGSLKKLIEESGLYPVTCITNLTKAEILQLVAKNIILCRTIHENPKLLDSLNIPSARKLTVLQQCQKLCEK